MASLIPADLDGHFQNPYQAYATETEIALNTLFQRIPDLVVSTDNLRYRFNPFFRGPVALQASWTT